MSGGFARKPAPHAPATRRKAPRQPARPQRRAETRDRGDRQTSAPVVPLAVERRPGTLAGEVRALNQAFRLGLFDAAMFERAEALLEQTKTVDPTRDPVLLKARSIVAAIMDQQGRGDLAREAVKEGDAVFDIVRSAPDEPSAAVPSGPEPALLREQIRFVAEHARMHLYRQARFLLARERLVTCSRRVTHNLPEQDVRTHGTMGLILYYTGCTNRQLGHLDEADACYGQAIERYCTRARLAFEQGGAALKEELALARHNTAIILGLGIAWTNSQRGFLTRSLNANVLPAEVLLMESQDRTHQAYLALLRGSIQRSLAGTRDIDLLKRACSAIEKAHRDFITPPYSHTAYATRASYELALCALAERNYQRAEEYTDRMDREAKTIGDQRWQANADMVRSRIARWRVDPDAALDHAENALRKMEGQEELLGVIDALVAKADALLLRHRRSRVDGDTGARDSLGEARDLLGRVLRIITERHPNQKIQAVAHLMLADSYVATGELSSAEAEYAQWTTLRDRVEHTLVREMGDRIELDLARMRMDFGIPWATEALSHELHQTRLRAWLIWRAESADSKSLQEKAERLGVSRQTLHAWLNNPDVKRELENLRRPRVAAGQAR